MNIVLWVCAVTGALVWAAMLVFLVWLVLDPGKGWRLQCWYGHMPYTKPWEQPECDWVATPVWYLPETTKTLRHRLHWWRKHGKQRG